MATALLVTAAVGAVAGAGIAAAGSYQQGRAQEAMAKYNQAMAQREAQRFQVESQAAERDARIAASAQRRQAEKFKGSQRAAYAASGVTFEGSPLLVMQATAANLELEALETERRGQIQAGLLREQGYTRAAESELMGFRGRSAKRAGIYQAGSSLLSGISSAATYGGMIPRSGGNQ